MRCGRAWLAGAVPKVRTVEGKGGATCAGGVVNVFGNFKRLKHGVASIAVSDALTC